MIQEGSDQSNFFNYTDELNIRIYTQRKNGSWTWAPDKVLEQAYRNTIEDETDTP